MASALSEAWRNSGLMDRLALVGQDVARGFMSTSRFIVTFVGCVTLLGTAAIVADESARARFKEHAPALLGSWLIPGSTDAAAAHGGDAGAPDPALTVVAARPEQEYIVRYLSRRYRVADEAVRLLVAEAYRAGQEHAVDPLLILAVMAIESSMNPFAESSVGAQGLMQVMTRVHDDKYEAFGGVHAAFDPVSNLRVGAQILKEYIRRTGSVEGGLKHYVGAALLESDGGYAAKVLYEQSHIQRVAQGQSVAVNVPSTPPAPPPEPDVATPADTAERVAIAPQS